MFENKTVGVAIPAFNEAPSIGRVVEELLLLRYQGHPLVDAVVVCDNGSTDATRLIAADAGANVVVEPRKGYGLACQRAIDALGEVDAVAFVDGDHSVVVAELVGLLAQWRHGADLVIGSRTLGTAEPGALMPQQRLGNWLAAKLLSRIWGDRVTDLGPFRVIDRIVLDNLTMTEMTYGWTVEMQIKALAAGLKVVEVPVTSLRRIGVSKVSGTLGGTIGASVGILRTISKYAYNIYYVK